MSIMEEDDDDGASLDRLSSSDESGDHPDDEK